MKDEIKTIMVKIRAILFSIRCEANCGDCYIDEISLSKAETDLLKMFESLETEIREANRNIESIQDKNEEIQALQVEIIVLRTTVSEQETENKQLQAVREVAEKVDWEGIILLVDGYPIEVVKLRELQQVLAAKDKDA